MAECLKERVSLHFNVPPQVTSGTPIDANLGVANGCLLGNWNEERFDSKAIVSHQCPAFGDSLDRTWSTTYKEQARCGSKAPKTAAQAQLQTQLDQITPTTRDLLHMLVPSSPTQALRRKLTKSKKISAATTQLQTNNANLSMRRCVHIENPIQDQTRMVDVVDGRHRAFPGHQPEIDESIRNLKTHKLPMIPEHARMYHTPLLSTSAACPCAARRNR